MEWLEIIELRSGVRDNSKLTTQLTDILKEINSEAENIRIHLFSSSTIETDFFISIEHLSGLPIKKSKLGRHIYMILKDFGLTNHKIWVKLDKSTKQYR